LKPSVKEAPTDKQHDELGAPVIKQRIARAAGTGFHRRSSNASWCRTGLTAPTVVNIY
jgi:hypothetical protein